MKIRCLNILLIIISVFTSVVAQTSDNIYIYRNDGRFNVFNSSEVDSMSYSHTGLDGARYDHPVIQEIYTSDSIYRIPLAVIDSISVNKPETIYAPGVKLLYPDYVPYIIGGNESTIEFSASLPYEMDLKKGDILFYDQFDDLFEDGFAGRVISVANDGTLKVKCEPVGLCEIYTQFFGFCEMSTGNAPALLAPKEVELDMGINANFSVSPVINALVSVKNGNTYVEVTTGFSYNFDANLHVGVKLKKEKSLVKCDIPVYQIIPGILKITVEWEALVELALQAGLDLGCSGGGSYTRTIICDNGKINLGENKFTKDGLSVDASLSGSGSVSFVAKFTIGLEGIARAFRLGIGPSFGRCLELEILDYINSDKFKLYDLLKESRVSMYNFAELANLEWDILKSKNDTTKIKIPLTGRVKYNLSEIDLVPTFSSLDVKADKNSINVNTNAFGNMLIPCQVGIAVLDQDENEVDSYYEDSSIWKIGKSLGKTFSRGLNSATKYTVTPIVKLFNLEMYAKPREEVYLDADVSTGHAFATTYSVRASGSISNESSEEIEVGFVYSADNLSPTVENAKKAVGKLSGGSIIDGAFSGLKAGTTYFYRAYACYKNKYYYGDTQCITTKRNCDRSDAENKGGDYVKGRQPFADIGGSFDIEEETAKIELDYLYIHPTAICSYHIEGDDKNGNRIVTENVTLGAVTGRNTIELDHLVPGTSYRFWGDIRSSYGNDVSIIGTFETKSSPDPYGLIVEVTDIEMDKAKVICKFDNIRKEFECGVVVSDGKWAYNMRMTPDETGMATIDLRDLLSETTYTLQTYISIPYEAEPIIGVVTKEFTTNGPDITGWWIFDTNDQAYAAPGPFDLNLLESGKTNNFYGLNFLHWKRDGRNLVLNTPTYATQVGMTDPVTCWEFYGRFNDDFTYCTGYIIYRNIKLNEVLLTCPKPFSLTRK